MDLQKIQVRADLERMVINYFLMEKISEEQSEKIVNYIDDVIGGGCFPEPDPGEKIIYFPGAWQEEQSPVPPKDLEPPHPHIRDYLYEQGVRFRSNLVWALHDLGAYNLETIAALPIRELESRRGIGKKSIDDLRAFLQSKGLDLKEDAI
jgi:hypothetical protein